MYKAVDPRNNFPAMEENILEFWKQHRIFHKSMEQRRDNEEFVFYDGPPFATGLPHFGHFVPGTIKDIIPRYKTMKGMLVDRRFGWDCHGLPVEYEMEKELGISGKKEIEELGIAKFNESCRSIVLRYTKEWEQIMTRAGRWVDFENDYKTMEPDYMESIWWVVKQLWEKNYLYEGHKILPYCARCSTVLSNHELNLGGYQDVHDPAITVRFRLVEEPDTSFLAWTTTPWTLPSNLALAVGPDIVYTKVQDGQDCYIMAEERLAAYYKDESEYKIIWRKKGSELTGIKYEPLFPYFAEYRSFGAFQIYSAEFVTTDEGTGIVHTAPGFGEDDYAVLKDTEIPTACPIDAECRFTAEVSDYSGQFVKDADKAIIQRLKDEGKLIKRDQYLHAYPHCWRCSSPLIYRAVSSWFVDIGKIKATMLKANATINWVPEHLRDGRFGKWLENARDWAISRNRYWGNPIPVWKCDSCEAVECIGSRAELKEKSGQELTDLHKHYVDEVGWACSCGGRFKRIPEVLDCWFESGAMPYAQNHYPFENKEHFEKHFPADFISEGMDQTRGWFYTLTILAAALFERPAFENVVVNGLVLAEDGKKMSKSLRNYSDPTEIMNQFGADALRLCLVNSPVVRAEDLRFSDNGVKEILKSIIIPLWNAYSFFVTYANIDSIRIDGEILRSHNPLDSWIRSESEKLILDVDEALSSYDLQRAVQPITAFIDQLNNWYIRRSRRRFWKSENDSDKELAYHTLYAVLMNLVKVSAPFMPFICEEIYLNLKSPSMPDSVHLCDFPQYDQSLRDTALEFRMRITQKAVSMGRALRTLHNLKTRQPLKTLHLVTRDPDEKKVLTEMADIIREELNVKEVILKDNEEDLVEYSAKANFKVLGKSLGPLMKQAAARISLLSMDEICSLLEGAVLAIDIENTRLDLTSESVIIQRQEKENLKVLNEGSLTLALDPEITPELRREGIVRDLIRGIQNLRKESGLMVTDRIKLYLSAGEDVIEAVESMKEHLLEETLGVSLSYQTAANPAEIECGDTNCAVALEKA